MALINCPECGKEISDKAVSCPNCGNPMEQQVKQEEYLCCPNCESRELHAEHKGFSGGKALTGALLMGGIGLLAGTIGSQDTQITCLKCGHKFKAGEAKVVKSISNELVDEAKIVELIKSQGVLYAVKWHMDTYGRGLSDAKNEVDAIRIKHQIVPNNTNGNGCSTIIVILVVMSVILAVAV